MTHTKADLLKIIILEEEEDMFLDLEEITISWGARPGMITSNHSQGQIHEV